MSRERLPERYLDAVFDADAKRLKTLLDSGINVNLLGSNGKTMLHVAVSKGYDEIVKLLIDHGADVNALDNRYRSVLHLACVFNKELVAKTLIMHGANIEERVGSKRSPLHVSCQRRNFGMIKFLIDNAANVNLTDGRLMTVLHKACSYGHMDLINLLLSAPNVNIEATDDRRCTPLHYACKEGNYKAAKRLIDAGANVNAKNSEGITPYQVAIEHNHSNLALLMSKKSTDLRPPRRNAPAHDFPTIARLGCIEKVNEMIAEDSKLRRNTGGNYDSPLERGDCDLMNALHYACISDRMEIAEILLGSFTKIVNAQSREERTPLHYAGLVGNPGMIKLLLENGATLSTADSNGNTALHLACINDNIDAARLLIDTPDDRGKYMDIDLQDECGVSPLIIACRCGNFEMAKLLIGSRASIFLKDVMNRTPLFHACENGSSNIVDEIMKEAVRTKSVGKVIHHRDKNFKMPLYYACLRGHLPIVKTLVSHGSGRIVSGDGTTSMHVAFHNGHYELVRWILSLDGPEARTDENSITLFQQACANGDVKMIEVFLESGVSTSIRNSRGESVIDVVRKSGQRLTTDLFDKHGLLRGPVCDTLSKIDEKDENGMTVLQMACLTNNARKVSEIISKKPNIDIKNDIGDTALHIACRGSHLIITSMLTSCGADVNIADKDGLTPLHIVCFNIQVIKSIDGLEGCRSSGNFEMIDVLMEAGADPTIKDNKQRTPLSIALDSGDMDVYNRMMENGCTSASKKLRL